MTAVEPAHGSERERFLEDADLGDAPAIDGFSVTAAATLPLRIPSQPGSPADPARAAYAGDAEQSLGSKVTRGASWSAASSLLLRVANLLITAVVARIVAPRDFGVFAVALTVHSIVSNIGELGVSSALMRREDDPARIAPTIATISILTSAVLAGGMAASAGALAGALGSPEAAAPIRIMALAVFMVGLFAVPSAILVRDFRQDKRFVADLSSFAVSSVALVGLAARGDGAIAFAWSRVIGQLVAGTLIIWFVKERYAPGWDRARVRPLLRFGLPLAGANMFNFALLNVDYMLVARLLGAVELGFYMLAFNVASWSSSVLSASVNGVAMPAFARVKDDAAQLRAYLTKAMRVLGTIAFPICALTFALATPLIHTLYGAKWAAASAPLAALGVYGAGRALCELSSNVLVGLGRTRSVFVIQVAWLVVLAAGMVVGIRTHGIVGAGFAHVAVVLVLGLPVYAVLLRRTAGVRPTEVGGALLRPLLAAALAGGTAYVCSWVPAPMPVRLLVGGVVGGIFYLSVMADQLAPLLARFGRGRRRDTPSSVPSGPSGEPRRPVRVRTPHYSWRDRPDVAPVRPGRSPFVLSSPSRIATALENDT